MFGAIIGDIAGSSYEHDNCKSEDCHIFADFSTFTDDTVLTLATAQHFLTGIPYEQAYQSFGQLYPNAGYGGTFIDWIHTSPPQPYNSWGNGSAMRSSPIGWVADDLDWALQEAKRSAEVTHNHPFGIQGAQAVAVAIFLARQGESKEAIRAYLQGQFPYNLDRTVESIRPSYEFDVSCQGSVPESIIAFLDSTDFEDCLRKAISLGGDSDTIACITGSIAHAFYKDIPDWMTEYCEAQLDNYLLKINKAFWEKYPSSS